MYNDFYKILKFSEDYDIDLYWSVEPTLNQSWDVNGKSVQAYFNCNDFFAQGADAEDITPDDWDLLNECADLCTHIEPHSIWIDSLFCAKKAKIRPLKNRYPKNKEYWPLFDSCGPEREN